MSIESLSKLSFFKIAKYEYKNEHVCNFLNIPRPHFCMGLLIRGSALFTTDAGDNISLCPGDIIFVPITSRYISKWRGSEDILYISMHFAFEPSCGISEKNRFALQKVTLPTSLNTLNTFKNAYNLYCGDKASQMKALGLFFGVLSDVLPNLTQKKQQLTDKRIEQAVEYINLNSEQNFSVEYLATMCQMSVSNFHMQFKKTMSMAPIDYRNHVRIGRATQLLKSEEKLSVEEISEMLGFESSTYFRKVFKKITGLTPSKSKKHKIEI